MQYSIINNLKGNQQLILTQNNNLIELQISEQKDDKKYTLNILYLIHDKILGIYSQTNEDINSNVIFETADSKTLKLFQQQGEVDNIIYKDAQQNLIRSLTIEQHSIEFNDTPIQPPEKYEIVIMYNGDPTQAIIFQFKINK